jgi:hypothetical protein
VISGTSGNILHIHHWQGEAGVPVQMARVTLEIETRGRDHSEAVQTALCEAGYGITPG